MQQPVSGAFSSQILFYNIYVLQISYPIAVRKSFKMCCHLLNQGVQLGRVKARPKVILTQVDPEGVGITENSSTCYFLVKYDIEKLLYQIKKIVAGRKYVTSKFP